MPAPISAIQPPALADLIQQTTASKQKPGEFQNALQGAIQSLETSHKNANDAVQSFLSGENDELHTTIMATQRAEIAFDLGLQVRNKVVAAYQEIMRMQM
ncbi:MAG: flagellar hook-basal body complex protein FliE [Bryobacteraceae bacterium]